MSKKIFIIGAILIGALISAHGCYTIIKHPSVMQADNSDTTVAEHAGGNRDCVSCHQDYHQYPYGYYYGYYPNYYWSNPRWGEYYAYPWWWDYYYDNGGNSDNGSSQPVPEGQKPAKRRGLEPPYTHPLPSLLSGDTLPPSTFNNGTIPPAITGPGGTTTGGTVTNPPTDKPKEPAKVEDKKPAKRRGGK